MRRVMLILIWLVAFAAIAVAIAPAPLAGVMLERLSAGTVALAETEGTLWRGSGVLTATTGFVRVPIAWSIERWPLLRGDLRLDVNPPGTSSNSPRAHIVARREAVSMRDVDITLPARIFEGLAPRLGIRTGGDVRITAYSLDWTPGAFTGGAQVDWQDALLAVSVDPAIRLGRVSAALAAAGDRVTGPITNDGGAYDVRGTLSLAANGAPSLSLVMTPRASDSTQARMLTIAGAPDGRWNVEFRAGPP